MIARRANAAWNFKLIGGADEAAGASKRCGRVKFNEQADANPGKCELNSIRADEQELGHRRVNLTMVSRYRLNFRLA
ncbi:hypothetical protein [uncultured Campylobacter sp.]|uniref:hypothetical protein n=1 Tax=uncultured Campylobacter sp. TaxID=218934 RepID=UPI0026182C1C|nr:hypothetical protein [uncultured Campylobacter sp.]